MKKAKFKQMSLTVLAVWGFLRPGYAHDYGDGFRQTAQIEGGKTLRCAVCRRRLHGRDGKFFSAEEVMRHFEAEHRT